MAGTRVTDRTVLADPNTEQKGSTEENPLTRAAKEMPNEPAQQDENKGLEQSAPEATVKHEEEDDNLETMVNSVAEGRRYKERYTPGSINIVEKGNIFFFFRHRVDVARARGIEDVARSFIVLRPASSVTASDIKNGSLGSGATFRLLAVPKKVLPRSGGVKEMGFVEKAHVTLKELQETFIAGKDYETKTHGARTIPEAKLYAKGVYTITSTQQSSYLAYILTDPKKLGPVQEDFGLHERGSWLVQSKNPKVFSPPSVSLPDSPDYPEIFDEKFGYYRWVPLRPELIDYPNAQFLLIGRSSQVSITPGGVKHEDRESPEKQLEDMAHDDVMREEQFRGVDAVYGDLGLEVYHYLKIPATWDSE